MNLRRTLTILTSLFILTAALAPALAQTGSNDKQKLIVFYSPSCHACAQVKKEVMPEIENEFKAKVAIEYKDITDTNNCMYLLSLKEKYNPGLRVNVPLFFFEGEFLTGGATVKNNLRELINKSLSSPGKESGLPRVNLIEHFKEFEPLAITGIGLVDGINPCAFTVIVFFISFLALQGYRKKELIPIGLSFIFAVFLTYILIGIGIFGFIYRLESFWIMRKVFNICIGAFSIILGLFAIYDFLKFKKTGKTEGLTLQLPQAVKNRIHYIIGLYYRKTKESGSGEVAPQKHILRLIITALFTGFLVSLIEAICTGQTYLPAIVFILKTTDLRIQALGYLLLYNFMFVLPLLVIFCFALMGATSEEFSAFLKKHLLAIKIVMAALFLSIGIFIIWEGIMKKLALIVLFLVLSVVGCYSQQRVMTENKALDESLYSWDFGQVKHGDIAKHNFTFKNETKAPLNIQDISTSCGCTVSEVKKKTLLAGEETSIEVRFDSKGYSGGVKQFIYLRTDNLDKPLIRYIIKADVVK